MSKKEYNPLTDWEIPSIYDIIDRMTLSFIFPPEEKKEVKKPRKMKSKKAKVKK